MSSNCSFELHINNLFKKCMNLTIWILRIFITRESLTMLTLFKSLVLSRLDYGSQQWSPHLVKYINLIERVEIYFTKHILAGRHDLQYCGILYLLMLYSLQRKREGYCIIHVWKVIKSIVPNFSNPITCTLSDRRGRFLGSITCKGCPIKKSCF